MSSRRAPLFGAAAALVIGGGSIVALAGCPGSIANPQDFTGAEADIIAPKCATAGCHDSKTKANGLDLTPDPMLKTRLVNVPPNGAGCMGLYVDPANPEQSLLYTKCTAMPPCGVQMPNTGAALTQDELTELLTWIQGLK